MQVQTDEARGCSLDHGIPTRCCRRTASHTGWSEHFLTRVPGAGETVAETARQVARDVLDAGADPLSMTVFGACAAWGSWVEALRRELPGCDWPITWVEGASVDGSAIAGVQAHGVSGIRVDTLTAAGRPVGRVLADGEARYVRLADIRPRNPWASREDQAYDAFEALAASLDAAGLAFGDVARTWLFIDAILEWYGGLNAARGRFLAEQRMSVGVAPASTGIGCANPHGVAMVAEALAARRHDGSPAREWLASPMQCPAQSYGSAFSRAVELRAGTMRRVLVSGTAAISQDGTSAHRGDPAAQLALTLEVVEALLGARGLGWSSVSRAIAYFRRAEDGLWLADRLGSIPAVIVRADVCRDDLLFEIEVDALG